MTKKGRRRRKMRAQAAKDAQSLQQQETTNVIQFPAQAKRAVSSQVAVNDVGAPVADTMDEALAPPPSEARAREEEEDELEEAEAKVEAPVEAAPEPRPFE